MKIDEIRETKNLEFKTVSSESVNKRKDDFKSFLKTVSAFANYLDGTILFGITDDKEVVPFRDPEKFMLDLENQINDNITPNPNYEIELNQNGTISLLVKKGKDTPYLYKGVAYRRSDSASIPVDRAAFMRLSLEGGNINFEDLSASVQKLTFETFSELIHEKAKITVSIDTYKTLTLYSEEGGYTNAAEWLSDQNSFETAGVIQFGTDISIIRMREVFDNRSILDAFYEIIDLFVRTYSYETIEKFERVFRIAIPEEAFREALANALVHRDWNMPGRISIQFYEDKVEITSPGGLPHGLGPEEYLNRILSVPRNPHLAYVFNRLGIIEHFGTGIRRIQHSYENSAVKPQFYFSDSSVSVVLPVVKAKESMGENRMQILSFLETGPKKKKEISDHINLSAYKTTKLLNELAAQGLIKKTGATKSQIYSLSMSAGSVS